jgi:hypothetical protein
LLGPVLAGFVLLLNQFLANNQKWVEAIYAQKIYPFVAKALSSISFVFPFSLSDFFYVLLIVSAILLLGLLVVQKISISKFFKIMLNILATVVVFFYLLWGFNYFREDIYQRIKLEDSNTGDEDFVAAFQIIIQNINQSVCEINELDKNQMDSLVELAYQKNAEALALPFPMGKRKDKGITFSRFFAKATISGYYGPFFNEVHVNKKVLPLEYPFVLAHEKAHQFGITSEAEANFYAWLICSNSTSTELKYSANLALFRFFVYQGYQLPNFPELISTVNEQAKKDYNRIQKHWKELQNEKIDEAATKANDTYLKANKIEKGINDYDGVVKHVLNFFNDSAFQKKWNLLP